MCVPLKGLCKENLLCLTLHEVHPQASSSTGTAANEQLVMPICYSYCVSTEITCGNTPSAAAEACDRAVQVRPVALGPCCKRRS